MMWNGILVFLLSVLFGFQPAPANLPNTPDVLAWLQNPGTVEITDNAIPLAGPTAPVTRNRTARTDGGVTADDGFESEAPAQSSAPTGTGETGSVTGETGSGTGETGSGSDTPVATPNVAQRLLARVQELLTSYNACTTANEKKTLLDASNYSLGNDAFRTKLLSDMGGSWEQVETEVVDATQYQQDKTLYAQVYMSGSSKDFQPVVYATGNADRSGNQWSTNLVYDEATQTWMEYVLKHPYNDSRVGYYMTNLAAPDSLEALQETMETSDLWQPVVVDTPEEAPAVAAFTAAPPATDSGDETPADEPEGSPAPEGEGTPEAPADEAPADSGSGEGGSTDGAPAEPGAAPTDGTPAPLGE